MKTQMIAIVVVVGLLAGCDLKRNEIAERTIDSLRSIVQVNEQMNKTLLDVGVLLDSIDANRNALRLNMVEGVTYQNYVGRMSDINQYVRRTERKLAALQKTARKSNNVAYEAAIKKLRGDLDARTHELAALKQQLEHYKHENEELISTVSLQKTELADKMNQLKVKQEETQQLEAQVSQLLTQSRLDQGEALYARAWAVEETASRTKFAPRKKKSSLRQALELYKQSLLLGKLEAQDRITALEKMI